MRITIENQAQVPMKYIRLFKWKMYRLEEKYGRIIYAEAFIQLERKGRKDFVIKVKLGVLGNDIVLQERGNVLQNMILSIVKRSARQIKKKKERNLKLQVRKSKRLSNFQLGFKQA